MDSSSSGGGTCAVLSKLGFCTLSVDVSWFCSGSFGGVETMGVGKKESEVFSKYYRGLVPCGDSINMLTRQLVKRTLECCLDKHCHRWLDSFYKNEHLHKLHNSAREARFYTVGSLVPFSLSIIIVSSKIFNSETSVVRAATSGEIPGVDEFELTLATTALFRELRTLDLLSIILKHSRGILSKKFPPAAEFNES
ncbi:hypothetical protein Tco_0155791 [Tanacetum coccineum]